MKMQRDMRDTLGATDRLYNDCGSGYVSLYIDQNSLNCTLTLMELILFRLYLSKDDPFCPPKIKDGIVGGLI